MRPEPLEEVGAPLIEKMLAPVNNDRHTPETTMPLGRFVKRVYLPHAEAQKRPSTFRGYKNLWQTHVKARCGNTRLLDFRTCDGERLLAEIARRNDTLTRSTLKRIKSLMSGFFKEAKRQGYLDGVNPMQDVSIPLAREGAETCAYLLEEIMQMLAVLPEPAATMVAGAAFTGMRRGELRGLRWEDYNGSELRVTQSVWQGFITEPKTRKSRAAVPVIGPLAAKLEAYRLDCGNPRSGLIFASKDGKPLDFNNVVSRRIKPALEEAGLGWHAFRRGLATNLYRLGIPDKTIQAILRHSDLATTQNAYIKPVAADAVEAMRRLEQVCTSMHLFAGASGGYVV